MYATGGVRSSVPGIRPIHGGDFSGHGRPLELSPDRHASFLLLLFIPLHQFVHKLQMWLNDDVEAARTYKATVGACQFTRQLPFEAHKLTMLEESSTLDEP